MWVRDAGLLLFLIAFVPMAATAADSEHLIINELEIRGDRRWIELHNPSAEQAIPLAGYVLEVISVNNNERLIAEFPEGMMVAPLGYVLVYPEGNCREISDPEREICWPFLDNRSCVQPMDKDGGLMILREPGTQRAVDRVRYPKLPSASSFGRAPDGSWCVQRPSTRGRANVDVDFGDSLCSPRPPVVINEISTAERLGPEEDCRFPGCPDWVELVYVGPEQGRALLDGEYELEDSSGDDFRFDTGGGPVDRWLDADHPYAVVILDKSETRDPAWPSWTFHETFGLKAKGDNLSLRRIETPELDVVAIPLLDPGHNYARFPDGEAWVVTGVSTPLAPNFVRPEDLEPHAPGAEIIDRFPLEVLPREGQGTDPDPIRIFVRARDPDEDLDSVVLLVDDRTTGELFEVPMRPGKPIACERRADSDVFVVELPRPSTTGSVFVRVRVRDRGGLESTTPAHEIFVQSPDWRDVDGNPTHVLRINEVSARDAIGDWVEIYNPSAQPISLDAMILTNDILRRERFQLPVLVVPAGEQMRIWLDGSFVPRDEDGEAHLPLVLDRCRDEVVLLHRDGLHVVDALAVKEERDGLTMGRVPDGSDMIALMLPTPGEPNEMRSCADFPTLDPAPALVINEVLADNWITLSDAGDEFGDWIEIYNPTSAPVPTSGWRLRDRGIVNDLDEFDGDPEWELSTVVGEEIAPGCFVLIWCDNDEYCERNAVPGTACSPAPEGELHTNFEINRWRDYVQLIDPCGEVVDCVAVGFQARDVSVGRVPDGRGSGLFLEPTPGGPNRPLDPQPPLGSCVSESPERFKELFDLDEPFPCATLAPAGTCARFKRGDANSDCEVNLADPISTLNYLFVSGAEPTCPDAADADDSGAIEITDPVFTLNYLFAGGPAPPPPGPKSAGPDPTSDGPDPPSGDLPPCTHSGCP